MAALNIDCPLHGSASEKNMIGTQEGKGMVMNFTFPCCDLVVKVTTGRATPSTVHEVVVPLDVSVRQKGTAPDAPLMIPTQRDRDNHEF